MKCPNPLYSLTCEGAHSYWYAGHVTNWPPSSRPLYCRGIFHFIHPILSLPIYVLQKWERGWKRDSFFFLLLLTLIACLLNACIPFYIDGEKSLNFSKPAQRFPCILDYSWRLIDGHDSIDWLCLETNLMLRRNMRVCTFYNISFNGDESIENVDWLQIEWKYQLIKKSDRYGRVYISLFSDHR